MDDGASSPSEDDAGEDHVMSEIHLGCPPYSSGPCVSTFTFSFPPPEVELIGSRSHASVGGALGSFHRELSLDEDGDLVLIRRSSKSLLSNFEQSVTSFVMTIRHYIATSIPSVGLQVWRAELVLSDFVLHKMLTSSEFDGIVAVELGAGTAGLIGILLARLAKTVFLTDHGTEVLENCAENVRLNSRMLLQNASIYVRELDWKAPWPPPLVHLASPERYTWALSEVEELHAASLLVAADIIYSDDLTDAFFGTVERLMSQGAEKVLYVALEKRFNFSLDDVCVVANGYSRFCSYIAEYHGHRDGQAPRFVGTRIDVTEIPQYMKNYERGQDVEIWEIKYEKRKT